MAGAGTPPEDDHASSAADLADLADANRDATWGSTEASKLRVPGIISGDVGVKGEVAAQLRQQSRAERLTDREVPRGGSVPGSGILLLVPMLLISAILLGLVVLLGWLLT